METHWMTQEIHDAVGHHVSLIALQAGVALHLFDRDPDRARRALGTIERHSRELLDELRVVLRGARGPRPPAAGSPPARVPATGSRWTLGSRQ